MSTKKLILAITILALLLGTSGAALAAPEQTAGQSPSTINSLPVIRPPSPDLPLPDKLPPVLEVPLPILPPSPELPVRDAPPPEPSEPLPIQLFPIPVLTLYVQDLATESAPTMTTFKANLSYVPGKVQTAMKVNFYNVSDAKCPILDQSTKSPCLRTMIWIGAGIVDEEGNAILRKAMVAGSYTVVASVVYRNITIWSNEVFFQVE